MFSSIPKRVPLPGGRQRGYCFFKVPLYLIVVMFLATIYPVQSSLRENIPSLKDTMIIDSSFVPLEPHKTEESSAFDNRIALSKQNGHIMMWKHTGWHFTLFLALAVVSLLLRCFTKLQSETFFDSRFLAAGRNRNFCMETAEENSGEGASQGLSRSNGTPKRKAERDSGAEETGSVEARATPSFESMGSRTGCFTVFRACFPGRRRRPLPPGSQEYGDPSESKEISMHRKTAEVVLKKAATELKSGKRQVDLIENGIKFNFELVFSEKIKCIDEVIRTGIVALLADESTKIGLSNSLADLGKDSRKKYTVELKEKHGDIVGHVHIYFNNMGLTTEKKNN